MTPPGTAAPAAVAATSPAEAACAALDGALRAAAPHLAATDSMRGCIQSVAVELKLVVDARAELDRAARVRDVGMIALPQVVAADRPLTPEEWSLVNRHPVLGAEMLEELEPLAALAPVVRHHHERWDGEGYPDGLRGAEAPRASRILAACDAFVAIATDRPYRRGMGTEAALEQVAEGRGSQFDPDVVDALIAVLTPRESRMPAAARTDRVPSGGTTRRADISRAVEELDALPALAPAHERLLALADDPTCGAGDLVAAVESDPGLTVAVLRAAQTPGRSRVMNIPDAVGRLGHESLAEAVRGIPLAQLGWSRSRHDTFLQRFRLHTVSVARAAARLSDLAQRKDHDDLLVAALLHDVGKLVLERMRPDYPAEVERPPAVAEERVRRERRLSGFDHPTLGALLVRRWGLPERLATAIAEHHTAEGEDEDATFLRLADVLAHHAQGEPVDRSGMLRLGYDCGLHPRVLRDVVFDLPHAGGSRRRRAEPSPLTARETEIVRRLADGKVYAEIAEAVELSTSTVRSHLHNAYTKLGVSDRAQAVLRATEQGWI